MKWSVEVRDEPAAPGPRYRVALNIGDDYVPLEPQETLDAAEDLEASVRGLIAVLIVEAIGDAVMKEREACAALMDYAAGRASELKSRVTSNVERSKIQIRGETFAKAAELIRARGAK